jgi:hypothetical protein
MIAVVNLPDEFIEVIGYVVTNEHSKRFVIEDQDDAYDKRVGERLRVDLWPEGRVVQFQTVLESDGFDIPYTVEI